MRDVLPPSVYREIDIIDKADIVIGIPSYNNAGTIGHVVEAAALGLAKYFPDLKGVIINSDGGSSDETPEVFMNSNPFNRADYYFMNVECIPPRKLSFTYKGIPGKGSAFRGIFEAAYLLKADLCIVVDSDLRSITPEWFEALGSPILDKGYDYVAPYYVRHKYDGTITNSISYPFTRALYGLDVRQPIGGDFGVAGTLLPNYLSRDVWDTDVAKYGIDIWMTTTAIAQGYKVAQAFLGCKIHDAKDPGEHLGPMFRQVVSTLMKLAGENSGIAGEVTEVIEVPVFGFPFAANPEPLPVDLNRLVNKFKTGFEENKTGISGILATDVFGEVESLINLTADNFNFPAELWVKVVFDYTAKIAQEGTPELVDSMIPLYYGRTAGFVKQTDGMSSDEAESVIKDLADIYFKNRDYLMEKLK